MNKQENLLNKLPFNVSTEAEDLFNMFQYYGYELYMVGGCVRDLIMDKRPKDIDFATNATPEEMKRIFAAGVTLGNYAVELLPTGEKYGTMTIRFCDDSSMYEITAYRNDGEYLDGRRPEAVTFSKTIEEDLSRRDFTCNAIAWNPEKGFVDPYNGIRDIENKILRAVGNPEIRFKEDALRILRCARFAIKYDFEIEENTRKAATSCVSLISNVSTERIGQEMMKILQKPTIGKDNFVFLAYIMNSYFCVSTATVHSIFCTSNIKLRFFLLFSNCLGEKNKFQQEYMAQFALDKEYNRFAKNLNLAIGEWDNFSHPKASLALCQSKEEKDALLEYLRLFRDGPKNIFFYERLVMIYQAILYNEPIVLKDLAINGNDISNKWGVTGVKLGGLLKQALEYIWVYPEKNNKKNLIDYLGGIIEQ